MLLARSAARQVSRRPRRGALAQAATSAGGGAAPQGERKQRVYVMDRGKKVEQKICVVCERPFTWRKKWERSWDEITTCSKRCNSERRRRARAARKARKGMHGAECVAGDDAFFMTEVDKGLNLDEKALRKARKKAAKAQRRKIREGKADASVGQKICTTCGKQCDLLIRCRVDATRKWHMVCGKCWHIHSGGVPDGDAGHPHYTYGGLWKNLTKL